MKAVHFGAGNIGRGFIGLLLFQSDYQTTFIDVDDNVIQTLNNEKEYKVSYASNKQESFIVKNVDGINSTNNPEAVIQAIIEADIITTAVGANILPIISKILAEGLKSRLASEKTLNIIACENMIGGSSNLKNNIYTHISAAEQIEFDEIYRFPNAAVDRIVPNQKHENILEVSVEPYFEWIVEDNLIGEKPPIKEIIFQKDLQPFIERKLFTVNTGHASVAYIGHYLGHTTISNAMQDERVTNLLRGVLSESGEALIQTYGFNRESHQQYIDTIVKRFSNKYISDEVTRVARGPLRKLGPNDRLIRPATVYQSVTKKLPESLVEIVALVLLYVNKEDEESVKLQLLIKEKGISKALSEVSKTQEESEFVLAVSKKTEELKLR